MPKAILKSGFFKNAQHAINYLAYLDKQSPLFSTAGTVSLQEALRQTIRCEQSIKWRHIFSLKGEDAARLSIDREYMQQLVAAQKHRWAVAHNISPENLVIYASYHEKMSSPHLHMVMYSTNSREGYILQNPDKTQGEAFKRARETTKSSIANQIFAGDLHELKVSKAEQRTSLNQSLVAALGKNNHPVPEALHPQLHSLSEALANVTGKHQYGYLSPELKQQVNDILRTVVEQDATIKHLFSIYAQSQRSLTQTYVDSDETLAEKMKEWTQRFFEPTKNDDTTRHNLLIQAAEHLNPATIERYKENMAAESDTAPLEATPTVTQLSEDTSVSEEVREAEYALKSQLEHYLRGKLPAQVAAPLCALRSELVPLTFERQTLKIQAEINKCLEDIVQNHSGISEALYTLQTAMGNDLPIADFCHQYLYGRLEAAQPPLPPQKPTPLHRLLLTYTPHMRNNGTTDLGAIQKEKDCAALRLSLAKEIDKQLCAKLDASYEESALTALTSEVAAAPLLETKDGTILPKLYRTLPKKCMPQICALVQTCWNEECTQIATALHKLEAPDKDLASFMDILQEPPRGVSASLQNLAVLHLLQKHTKAPGAPQIPRYQEQPQNPKEEKPILTAPTEQESMAAWRLKLEAEKVILKSPLIISQAILRLHDQLNLSQGTPTYFSLDKNTQKSVDTCAEDVLRQRSLSKWIEQYYLASPRQTLLANFKQQIVKNELTQGLHSLILDYAAAATPQNPISQTVPACRIAEREISVRVDAAICTAFNNADSVQSMIALADSIVPVTPKPENDDIENKPITYAMLPESKKQQLCEAIPALLAVPDVQLAIAEFVKLKANGMSAADFIKARCTPIEGRTPVLHNLLLRHLHAYRDNPDCETHAPLMRPINRGFREKSSLAAMRSLLYAIGSTLHADTQRKMQATPPKASTRKKIHVKKIHKESSIEIEPIEAGGK